MAGNRIINEFEEKIVQEFIPSATTGNANNPHVFDDFFEYCRTLDNDQKRRLANYLLAKAIEHRDDDKEQFKYAITLFKLITYFELPKYDDTWNIFTLDKRYQEIIDNLTNRRSLRTDTNVSLFHEILKEGIRSQNKNSLLSFIRYNYEGLHGYSYDPTMIKDIYLKLAKNGKDHFFEPDKMGTGNLLLKTLQNIEENPNKKETSKDVRFIECLGNLCRNEYFVMYDPRKKDYLQKKFDDAIENFGIENVKNASEGLGYNSLIFLLALHYKNKAKNVHNDDRLKSYFITESERLLEKLENSPAINSEVKKLRESQEYQKILADLSKSTLLNEEEKKFYSLRLLKENNIDAFKDHIIHLLDKNNIEEAKYWMDRMSVFSDSQTLLIFLKELLGGDEKRNYSQEIKKNIVSYYNVISSNQKNLNLVSSDLNYEEAIGFTGEKDIYVAKNKFDFDILHFSSNKTVYTTVTKYKKGEKSEEIDETKPQNDPYKLYLSFDPSDSLNYRKAWAILNKILVLPNVYGIKLLNPREALKNYTDSTINPGSDVQPGKMGVIYFKKYEDVLDEKKERGEPTESFTKEKYYLDNLAVIRMTEELCNSEQYRLKPREPQYIFDTRPQKEKRRN